MNYIDSHVHVWTDEYERYPLASCVAAEEVSPRRFLPGEILARARPSGVSRVVLVQMSCYQTDNRYMLDVIASAPETFRGIAVIDARSPEGEMRRLASLGVRGFRIGRDGRGRETWPETAGYDRLFRCAAEDALAVCPLIDPEALPSLGRMCDRFRDTRVVVDHLARIGMAGAVHDEDVDALCALARFPEVRVKVSAFYALGGKRPPHVDLAGLVRRIYDAYGPERLMWGSDCPFQLAAETYEDSISLVRDRLDFLTTEDREWMLRRTAEAVFFS